MNHDRENHDTVCRLSDPKGDPVTERSSVSEVIAWQLGKSSEVSIEVTIPPKVKHALYLKAAKTGTTK
jgi:hypothetical protein